MGPRQLHTEFIGRNDKNKRDGQWQHNITDFPGTAGIDISGPMHKKLSTQKGAAVFDMEPKVPLYNAVSFIMKDLRSLLGLGVKNLIVFLDGRSHPMKEATEAGREAKRQNNMTELLDIYKLEDSGQYDKVKKLRPLVVYRRDDFTSMLVEECRKCGIKVVCSPFEADFQLVEAQRAGIIDIIISDDGDLFVMGGDKIATELDYRTGSCSFYERSTILPRQSMGGGKYANCLAALSCFLGNDFIDRLDGSGPDRTRRCMEKFINGDDTERKMLIDEMAITRKWKRGDEGNASDFAQKFWKAYNIQMFAPVFRLHASSDDVDIDVENPATYEVTLEPLNPLPEGVNREEWGNMIGFGCDPSSLLKGDPKQLFTLDIMPTTGAPPELLGQPVSEYEPHHKVAHGANPDINIPVRFWSDWAIESFLCERGLRLRGSYNRENSLRLALRVVSLMKELGPRAPQPREYKEGAQTAYDEEEPLDVSGEGESLIWNASWSEFTSVLGDIDTLSDDDFFNSFGTGRNGIQTRAQKLITGGHFDVEKIQTARCSIKANGNPAVAIRMECVPSMKKEAYWVMFVVDLTTKKFVFVGRMITCTFRIKSRAGTLCISRMY